jgi:outer membrane immunogenic protein
MFLIVGLASAALAVPSFAQSAEPFNGAFIGAQAGWQQDRQTLEVRAGNTTTSIRESGDGFLYGGQIGYDFRLGGPAVLGLEVGLTGRTGGQTFLDGVDRFRLTQGRTFTTTARLGVLTDPQGLAYVRGGYTNARFTADDGFDRESANRDGWTLGAGYERSLGGNLSARLEYNYSDFGRDRLSFIEAPGVGADLKFRRHAVTTGVNFRF